MSPRLIKLIKFLAAGLPSFVIAVPLNWLFVGTLHMPKPVAYGIVLVFQVSLNFFMCRWFVFEKKSATSLWRDFATFFAGIALFRAADWGVYTLLTHLGFWYLGVQLFNVFLFSILKFLFSERTLR